MFSNNAHVSIFNRGSVCVCDILVNVLDCETIESEFEIKLHYYIHFFCLSTLEKGINFLMSPTIDKIISLMSFYKDDFEIRKSLRGVMADVLDNQLRSKTVRSSVAL